MISWRCFSCGSCIDSTTREDEDKALLAHMAKCRTTGFALVEAPRP